MIIYIFIRINLETVYCPKITDLQIKKGLLRVLALINPNFGHLFAKTKRKSKHGNSVACRLMSETMLENIIMDSAGDIRSVQRPALRKFA